MISFLQEQTVLYLTLSVWKQKSKYQLNATCEVYISSGMNCQISCFMNVYSWLIGY